MQTYILGGYTKRSNQGIASIQLDPQAERLSDYQVIDQLEGSTFVTLSQDKSLLFAIDRHQDQGGIVAYQKDGQAWKRLDQIYTSQKNACHLSYHDDSRTIYASNYHEGSIDVYHLSDQCHLSHLQRLVHQASSVHPNQTNSHLHFTGFGPYPGLLYACDLGGDLVYTYRLQADGQLVKASELQTQPGMGPRHLVFHPNGKYAYIIGELNNQTLQVKVKEDGSLEALEYFSNLGDQSFDRADGGAIRISQDGHFLYTSTRFADILTVFQINNESGQLDLIQTIPSGGEIPRDFTLSADDRHLLVGHQDSDQLALFRRDSQTGELSLISRDTLAPECVCLALA